MSRRTALRRGLGVALAVLWAFAGPSPAQDVAGGDFAPARAYPQGGWAQVLSVTPKWLVIQNAQGQQFPISFARTSVNLFVVRWPVDLSRVSDEALVEVLGLDAGSNQIRAPHLDVFEGNARALLGGNWPSVTRLVGPYNRVANQYTVDRDDAYRGYDFLEEVLRGSDAGIPDRLHVVAPIVALNPLRLNIGNNNVMTVLPANAGTYVTQVTLGAPSYVKPGDLVYFLPVQATPKSLTLAQLVVYKRVPFDQFGP